MKDISSHVFKIALAIFFVHHFFMVAIYLVPYATYRNLFEPYNSAYIQPLFSQKWNMFAPIPLMLSSELVLQCKEDDLWISPTSELIASVNHLPLIHLQKIMFAYNSIVTALLEKRTLFAQQDICTLGPSRDCAKLFPIFIRDSAIMRTVEEIGRNVCGSDAHPRFAIHISHSRSPFGAQAIAQVGYEVLRLN